MGYIGRFGWAAAARVLALAGVLGGLVMAGMLLAPASPMAPRVPAAVFLSPTSTGPGFAPSAADTPGVTEVPALRPVEIFDDSGGGSAANTPVQVSAGTGAVPSEDSTSPAPARPVAPSEPATTEPGAAPSSSESPATSPTSTSTPTSTVPSTGSDSSPTTGAADAPSRDG